MFKGILILLFIGLITVFVIVMVALSFVRSVIQKVKQMLGIREYPDEDEVFGSHFSRKNQQYHYQGGAGTGKSGYNGGAQGGFGGQSAQGTQRQRGGADNNVVDMRDSSSQHRKIFSKDEGEYVSYEEVDN